MTATAAPSTVMVAARPRDSPVLGITNRTGNSNTSARKMPTKTTRKVSPMATNAAITASVATTSTTVRSGSTSSTRRLSRDSMPRFKRICSPDAIAPIG